MTRPLGCWVVLLACAPAVAEWRPVVCPEVEHGAEGRFEAVREVDGFERGVGVWRAHRGDQNAKSSARVVDDERRSGRAALRVDYQFTAGKEYDYVALTITNAIPSRGEGLGLWMKTDGVAVHVNVRIADKSGEVHQLALSPPADKGWGFLAAAFDGEDSAWGGDGNKKLDYPCRLDSLVIDRNSRECGASGALWIDDVAIVRPRKPTADLRIEAWGVGVGNLFAPGDEIRLRAWAPKGEIRWRVFDWRGRTHAEGAGAATGTDVRFSAPGQGYFACRFALIVGGVMVEDRDFHAAVLGREAPRNDFVGACVHFMRREAWPIEGMEILPRLGITQVRDDFTWASAERQAGKIALGAPQVEAIERGVALGVRWLGILCYANPNYDGNGFPNSPDAVAAYARFGAALAKQLSGKVGWFEVWNEWSGGCGMHGRTGDHGPEAYARLIRAAYPAIKALAPGTTIVGLGGEHSEHHFEKIRGMFAAGAGGAMDAWSVHPYRYPKSPEDSDLIGELRRVAEVAAAAGAPRSAWITEIGWPTHVTARGVDEATQARMIVRSMALMQASGFVDKVFWYDFKDDGLDRAYNENNFGIVRHQAFNFAPKPAAAALAVFSRMTAGAKAGGLRSEGDAFAARYGLSEGRELLVAWSPRDDIAFAPGGEIESVADMMGNPLAAGAAGHLGPDPIYVVIRVARTQR